MVAAITLAAASTTLVAILAAASHRAAEAAAVHPNNNCLGSFLPRGEEPEVDIAFLLFHVRLRLPWIFLGGGREHAAEAALVAVLEDLLDSPIEQGLRFGR